MHLSVILLQLKVAGGAEKLIVREQCDVHVVLQYFHSFMTVIVNFILDW